MMSKFFRRIFGTVVIGIICLLVASAFTMTAFAASSGDVGAWADTTPIPQSLALTNSVTYNGYVYVIGGKDGITAKNTVYSAPLNLDGTVGTWATTTPLPQPLSSSTSVVYDGYVYVMGGINGATLLNTVYSALLNPDGTVGAWATSVNTLPQTIIQSTSIVHDGYIYVMGGFHSGTTLNTVYSASISDGVVDTWATSDNTLPQTLRFASAITYNDYAYVIGGDGNSGGSDLVYSAPLGASGTIGTWATSANTLPKKLTNHNAVSYNGYAYVIGGNSSSDPGLTDAVYSAPLGASGTIGTWATSANTLPQGLRYASAITYNGYVYNIGGDTAGGSLDNVYYAQLTGYLPPSSSSQSANASSGSSVTVDVLSGVSGNPDPSTLQIITGPGHGAATISGSNITYTATSGYVGSDSLVFQVCSLNDASICTQSTLSFTVTAAVDAVSPVFVTLPGGSAVINITEGQDITTNPFIITVKATDDTGVSRVEFYIDDILICTTTTPDANGVYSCAWDTSKYHSDVTVYAYDAQGNRSEVLQRNATVSLVGTPNTGLNPANILPASLLFVAGIGLILVARRRYS